MNTEILDEPFDAVIGDKHYQWKLLVSVAFTILGLFGLTELTKYLPENLFEWEGTKLNTSGLIFIIFIAYITWVNTKIINNGLPNWKAYQIAIYAGAVAFIFEFIFNVIYQLSLWMKIDNFIFSFYPMFIQAGIIALFCVLFSNIVIRKRRNQSYGNHVVVSIFGLFAITQLWEFLANLQ